MKMEQFTSVDEYIAAAAPAAQAKLKEIRKVVNQTAPEASEKISYGIPTLVFHGNLVHFGGYDTHIGFYPGSGPIADFKAELEPYESAKGTVRFPLDKPLPTDLIKRMTENAVARNLAKKKK